MSYQIGLDTIFLRPSPRLGHTEYCSNDRLRAAVEAKYGQPFEDAWEFDLIWNTHDGPVPWGERGRVTDMGHAEFLEGGVDRRAAKVSPFQDLDEVRAFDAVSEYGLPDFEGLITFYEEHYQAGRRQYSGQVFTGGYYKTIVSGAIDAFGWEWLLMAAADQDAFERILDSIFRLSLHHYRAWARASIEVFISHDDMVWTQGAFMDPAFYRRVIFPRYAALWKPLKDAGKKVLFCSDGDWSIFLPDIAEAGADGFIFEPMAPLERVVRDFGKTHVIVGSAVDCRTLTFNDSAAIRAQVDATIALAMDCPGFIAAVGNHIPSNVPVENAMFYFDYLRAHWRR